jgi:hypothetical protein
MGCASFSLSLAFPLCLPYDGFDHRFFIGFLCHGVFNSLASSLDNPFQQP